MVSGEAIHFCLSVLNAFIHMHMRARKRHRGGEKRYIDYLLLHAILFLFFKFTHSLALLVYRFINPDFVHFSRVTLDTIIEHRDSIYHFFA